MERTEALLIDRFREREETTLTPLVNNGILSKTK